MSLSPCWRGRVSHAHTEMFFPFSCAVRMIPKAVPCPAVAWAPVLQIVKILPLPPGDKFGAIGPDGAVHGEVFISFDCSGLRRARALNPFGGSTCKYAFDRPFEIDGRWT